MRHLTLAVVVFFAAAAVAAGQAPPPPAGGRGAQAGPQGAQGGGGRGGARGGRGPAAPAGPIKRMPDGKPDLTGHFGNAAGGANYGLEKHPAAPMLPPSQGIVLDPPDGRLPYQDWARKEFEARGKPERGYDDPTAHCFVAGFARSLWTPSPYQILQPPGYLVILMERMAWRIIPIDPNRKHLPDDVRLWQGDSIGHWEGDTLVVDTANNNGKTWMNEAGDVISYAATAVERFTPINADTIDYKVTITDPVVMTRPYTLGFQIRRQTGEILEVACLEDNQDLEHLKHVKDEARKNGLIK
ncbi:MAG TPA: hypothetical protein VL173_04200 [Vicinamibacterales bacterium]|jgi:hypothetical protein|nr:hypothetical protein [Vicinamibacterales bacterium]